MKSSEIKSRGGFKKGDALLFVTYWSLEDVAVSIKTGARVETFGKKQGTAVSESSGQPVKFRIYNEGVGMFHADERELALAWARATMVENLQSKLRCAQQNALDYAHSWGPEQLAKVEAELARVLPLIPTCRVVERAY